MPPDGRLRVLCIGSMTRGGSTILAMLLGCLRGVLAGTEYEHIWLRGLYENSLCSCGVPFLSCSFWSAVGDEAFAGWSSVDAQRMIALQRSVERHRHVPLHLLPTMPRGFRAQLEAYTEILTRLYRAVRAVSGCRWIVDNSKHPPAYFTLRRLPEAELRLVHLVRDPRGIAYSWLKQVRRPDVAEVQFMPRLGPLESSLTWIDFNLHFHLLEWLGVPRRLIRYEDLVAEPHSELLSLLRWLGEEAGAGELEFVRGGGPINLPDSHVFSGNPVRFRTTGLVVREDDEWKKKLPTKTKALVTAATAPLLWKYGYGYSLQADSRTRASTLDHQPSVAAARSSGLPPHNVQRGELR